MSSVLSGLLYRNEWSSSIGILNFEDIVNLYELDEELRGLFFKYLCRIERKLRSSISYHFCQKHGERQEEYLNPNNYNMIPKNMRGIIKLL